MSQIFRWKARICVLPQATAASMERKPYYATGASYRKLGVPGEDDLIGTNIHFCATCDGAFYKDRKVLVIGGGNSGFEEGLFLTRFARQVDIVEFAPEVKASRILQEKVAEQLNMTVITNHAVREFKGKHKLEAVVVEDAPRERSRSGATMGYFVFIGLTPNNDLVKSRVNLIPYGFVATNETLMSSLPGLFAAGDVRAGSTKQPPFEAGKAATAALMIRQFLRRKWLEQESPCPKSVLAGMDDENG